MRRRGQGLLHVGVAVGVVGAITEAAVLAVATNTADGPYRYAADYWLTASGLPVAVGAVLVLAGVRLVQDRRDGRLGQVGLGLVGVTMAALCAVLLASLFAGQDVQGGPTYVASTALSWVGVALCSAGSWRVGMVPRWLLVVWPVVWAVGSFFAVSVSPLLLAALYVTLLVVVRSSPVSPEAG
ncbi:hypothetical protein DV701_14155 [Ornithinimicrobium avium]|uniref:DUF998 domain-containing protein n=1 Tax=Ornithinimicrobium avium TaxID=2283195 RepID=A0A345NQ00_9MICO|nr:hypothetical protein DV701_14155 [Ornithinimicrobium avium]